MRRRYIALQRNQDQWLYAVASRDRQKTTLQQVGRFEQKPGKSLAEALIEEIGPLQMVDRLASALPAQSAMLRWLDSLQRHTQIAVTAPPEMSRQIPCSAEDKSFTNSCLSLTGFSQSLLTTTNWKSLLDCLTMTAALWIISGYPPSAMLRDWIGLKTVYCSALTHRKSLLPAVTTIRLWT